MLKQLFQKLRDKKSEVTSSTVADGMAEGSALGKPGADGKLNRKVRFIIIAAAGILTVVVGFVTGATVLRSLNDHKEQPALTIHRTAIVSNLPKYETTPLQQTLEEDTPHLTGDHQAAAVQNEKGTTAATSAPEETSKQFPVNQESPVKIAKKEAGARPVAEFDPFKTEFQKKYEEAEKKEKKTRNRNSSNNGGDLTRLEEMVKASSVKPAAPVVQLPPSPPPLKDLRINIYGVVVSKKDTYALTDRGVIRTGSDVDTFRVERIEFDAVTLISRENDKDVRNISITGRGSQSGTATPPVVPLTIH